MKKHPRFVCLVPLSPLPLVFFLGCSDSPLAPGNNGGQGGTGGSPISSHGGEGGSTGGAQGDASLDNSAGMAGESSSSGGEVDAGGEVECSELSPPCAGQDCVVIQAQPFDTVRECIAAPVAVGCSSPVDQGGGRQFATDSDGNCWIFGSSLAASGFTIWNNRFSEYPCFDAVEGDTSWPECPPQ